MLEINTDIGKLFYPSGDLVADAIERDHVWEPKVGQVLRDILKTGSTFVDIGAHVGYFTVMAAQLVGKSGNVYAFEPLPDNCELLAKNVAAFDNCSIFPMAVWGYRGTLELFPSVTNSGDNRFFEHNESAAPLKVPVIPLDELKLDKVDLIKIDSQGADHVVILGAEKTIRRCQPKIIVEFWPDGYKELGIDPRDILAFYDNFGFTYQPLEVDTIPLDTGYINLKLELI